MLSSKTLKGTLTLPNQMSEGMMDIIKISPELAETLPFYKTRTQSFDAAQFLLGEGGDSSRQADGHPT